MKKILVISYSQSGQLDRIIDHFLIPFDTNKIDIDRVSVQPATPFPFPWDNTSFFSCMSDCVLENPIELNPIKLKHERYDLIIVGYQPWFLSPSLPTTGLFHTPEFTSVLKDTPVITLIGSRNMWINSQHSIVHWIEKYGGKIVANIPFIDRVQNHVSSVTIVHWMMTGKKTRKWGFMPLPGISEEDITGASQFGELTQEAITSGDYSHLQDNILNTGKIVLPASIMLVEKAGKRIFKIWAKLIQKKGTTQKKKEKWSLFFYGYLFFALYIVSPIVIVVYTLLILPLTYGLMKRNKKKYLYLGIKA